MSIDKVHLVYGALEATRAPLQTQTSEFKFAIGNLLSVVLLIKENATCAQNFEQMCEDARQFYSNEFK